MCMVAYYNSTTNPKNCSRSTPDFYKTSFFDFDFILNHFELEKSIIFLFVCIILSMYLLSFAFH